MERRTHYEKVRFHLYYDDGDVHAVLLYVYDFRASISDIFSISEANHLAAYRYCGLHVVFTGRLYRSLPVYYFTRRFEPMENYFEKLVRANFRFGRMCRCI